MPAKINLLNQTFGKLFVLEETSKRKNKSVVWKCKCECGNITEFSTKELRSDGVIQCSQCGHNREPKTNLIKDIIGNKYNHLTVLEKTNLRQAGKILYKCECDCSQKNIVFVNKTDLENGHTKSCGCIRRKYNINSIINNRKIIGFSDKKDKQNNLYYKCECLLCNSKYDSTAQSLKNSISCGCQKSIGEFNITQILNQNKISYQKEYIFKNTSYRFDFAILKNNEIIRLIEFDGEQHYENNVKNSGWNTYEKYEHTFKNDLAKNKIAKDNNIPLVRIPYWERDNITLDLILGDKYLVNKGD